MSNSAGQSSLQRKLVPVCLAFLAAPLVWAVLYWVVRLPAGTLLAGFSADSDKTTPGGYADFADSGVIWLLLQAVLLYPVLEEIVFRGALQGWLLERPSLKKKPIFRLISVPNLLASLAFTALHFVNQPPIWAALVFVPSLVFGWAREHSGGLLLPILLHIWYNAGFYVLFVRL